MSLYIIMMGVQGAGKGMQAGIISDAYNIPQISTGDLFRAMFGRDDELAMRVKAILKAGDLVPDDVTCQMVADRLAEPDAVNGAILDGFPRNIAQADWLRDHLAEKNAGINAVILMELDLFTAFKRAFGRVSDKETGKSHNIYFNTEGLESWEFVDAEGAKDGWPPRLEAKLKSGNPAKRREDDANAHAVVVRIEKYLEETMPLIEYYEAQGVVDRVDANKPIDAVTADIKAAVEALKNKV